MSVKRKVLYIHGKGGNARESEHYRALFPDCEVIGFDYRASTPWEACEEFPQMFEALCGGCGQVTLIANSIGAYFSMCALPTEKIRRAYFISPIVDMERLIGDMMRWAKVSEAELRARGEIETEFGETLSWRYLQYARNHPVRWRVPTEILYGAEDRLTSRATITAFAQKWRAALTVMEQGEHWFHTPEQLAFLDAWMRKAEEKCTDEMRVCPVRGAAQDGF